MWTWRAAADWDDEDGEDFDDDDYPDSDGDLMEYDEKDDHAQATFLSPDDVSDLLGAWCLFHLPSSHGLPRSFDVILVSAPAPPSFIAERGRTWSSNGYLWF